MDIDNNGAIVKATNTDHLADLGLAELAAVVCAEIQKCRTSMANALAAAMNAGDALIAVRPKVEERGFWTKWLRENCYIAESTAKLYIQLAQHRDEIEARILDGVQLSLRAARKLISKPPPEPPPEPEPEPEHHSADDDAARIHQFFAQASGAEILGCMRAARPDLIRRFLDALGVDDLLECMSGDFGRMLRARVPAPKSGKSSKKPISRTMNNAQQPHESHSRH